MGPLAASVILEAECYGTASSLRYFRSRMQVPTRRTVQITRLPEWVIMGHSSRLECPTALIYLL